ncbi:MAG: response regulator [Nitrospirota bacterium]
MAHEITTKVLLVDDEDKFLDVLSQRLEKHDVKADTAASGEDALAKIKDTAYDAVVLDLMMPGIGGIETLRRIRKENPELQVIMLSGRGTIEKAVESVKEGAMDFLEKPAEIDTLLAKIEEARHKKILFIVEHAEERIGRIWGRKA